MPQFLVRGLKRDTGAESSIRVSAPTVDRAREMASEVGVISENVEMLIPDPPPPPPIDLRAAWNDVRPPASNPSTPVAAHVCGVVSVLLYLVAAFAWVNLADTISSPKGVTGLPLPQFTLALGVTAAAALLHAASAALRLLARIAPRA